MSSGAKSAAKSSASVSTKQVHPVTLTSFPPTGCELSIWAYLTVPRPSSSSDINPDSQLPNLVTAHANSLKIYVVDPISGTLILASSYDNLAGVITTLDVLPNAAGTCDNSSKQSSSESYDGLLLGFAGHPRMSIVYPPGSLEKCSKSNDSWSGVLTASSIIDLTPALIEKSMGSVAPLEQDLTCSVTQDGKIPTVAVILGGGVSIAAFQLPRSKYSGESSGDNAWWRTASEPYFLPLPKLSSSLSLGKQNTTSALYNKYQQRQSQMQNQNVAKISHGFGDILSSAFLTGYTEPVLVILHANPQRYGGRACSGRLGHHGSATRNALCLTAISISITQKRSVVLWSLPDAMPADAFELHPHPKGGILVMGVNEILYVNSAGKIECCTAVNGWVRSTGSAALLPKSGTLGGLMQPNPSPLTKLSIQLDGSRLSFVNDNVAMLSLRDGTLYSLELHDKESCIGVGGENSMCMSLAPIGKKLGGIGMVSALCALPLMQIQTMKQHFQKFITSKSDNTKKEEMTDDLVKGAVGEDGSTSLGLLFAASRMGNSTLMLYNLKEKLKLVPLEGDDEQEKAIASVKEQSENETKRKREEDESGGIAVKKEKIEETSTEVVAVSEDEDLSEEEILRREEEALYADGSNEVTSIQAEVENKKTLLPGITANQLFRPQIQTMSIFQSTEVLDCLIGLGPIGKGTTGPTPAKDSKDVQSLITNVTRKVGKNTQINVQACGFGSSGGLAVMKTPGSQSGSTILGEVDCLDIGSIFPCTGMGYFFVVKKGENAGCIIMKLVGENTDQSLEEVHVDTLLGSDMEDETPIPSFTSVRDVLTRMEVLSVKEFKTKDEKSIKCMLVVRYGSACSLIILDNTDGKFSIEHSHFIGANDDGQLIDREDLVSVSFVEHLDSSRILSAGEDLSLGCVWSSGHASLFSISFQDYSWFVKEVVFPKDTSDCASTKVDDNDPVAKYYASEKITAMDIFAIADNIFEDKIKSQVVKVDDNHIASTVIPSESPMFDEDDIELYGADNVAHSNQIVKDSEVEDTMKGSQESHMPPSRYNTLGGYISGAGLSASSKVVIAIARQSGRLEIYDVSSLLSCCDASLVTALDDTKAKESALLWSCDGGFGQGSSYIALNSSHRNPHNQESCAKEMRFFFSGPSNTTEANGTKDFAILRSLCVLVETSQGDSHLYSASKSSSSSSLTLSRVSLGMVSRLSKDEIKHRNKLRRKGVVKEEVSTTFRPNRLHRFFGISGEDGLFAAVPRPYWVLSERGAPSIVNHRLRHCAPAGGTEVPITGFCSGFSVTGRSDENGFITVHDRIGRVGSQRLTIFNSLSDVFTKHGIFPGGGMIVEKIPLGVTVREIEYIEDPAISSAAHPVYALLISKEVENDLGHLNDDGLTPEEREQMKEEKEKNMLAKQVEADLGGFEIDQEWVAEIDRDDCFEIEKRYGGCPSNPQSKYEVWIVDGSTWQMLDMYQLDDYEHGTSMKAMTLTDIPLDTSGNTTKTEDDDFKNEIQVLAVGTGVVDEDGEDVCSKGRIVLFDLKRVGDRTGKFEIEMNFLYDKDISIGPVTSVNCLTCEGTSRLVVGAGAEITLEQWGNDKLTQVGFYHCYMHVQDVVIFKNFVLICDAYDSLHFLVFRESDKSLTLLAKDYEPTSVYAAGLLSRGGTLSFVCHDDRQNLTFLSYSPRDVAARGGNKLVCQADCHLGTQTTSFGVHFCRSSLLVNSATRESTLVALKQQDPLYGKLDDDKRFGLHYGSTDSSFGTIIPINEGIYWRLAALQSVMSNALESDCSLSHRAWRLYRRAPRRGGCRSNDRKKGVIDGDLVLKFADLPICDQEDIASAIGSTVDLIMDNLLEVEESDTNTCSARPTWKWELDADHNCNVRRVSSKELSQIFKDGLLPPLYHEPLVIYNEGNDYSIPSPLDGCILSTFISQTSLENIASSLPENFNVTLSSSNSFSAHRRTIPLEQYLEETLSSEILPSQLSNETWYLFGETYSEDWQKMLSSFCLPPCQTCTKELSALAFGIGSKGSGVQWHTHSTGFSQSIHGRKHWVLYPPEKKPNYDPDYTSRYWMEEVYTKLPPDEKPFECTLHQGEMIYFPDKWHHSTINLDTYTVFVSTFTTEHGF